MDYRRSSSLSRSLRDDDFDESEVWDVIQEPGDYKRIDPGNSIPRRIPSAAAMIPRLSSSSANYSIPEPRIFQQSAPVNVPDWSRIGAKKDTKKGWGDSGSYGVGDQVVNAPADDDEEYETGSGSVIPPHEFIASRLARSHISSFSVFEGVGRTLKGRDLSKVRNAVLTKTGFLESR
ncbi:hypothetical protein MLD38_022072 [Melastoma candidum]|uniref:Uncharacterized protein n=1 Tax=Melastoma candidum TaxID=119954 RepID=A0ACB9QR68_9MYRT|nr:hypothetical protein MLD38_022072 [Melastoma candidum]